MLLRLTLNVALTFCFLWSMCGMTACSELPSSTSSQHFCSGSAENAAVIERILDN